MIGLLLLVSATMAGPLEDATEQLDAASPAEAAEALLAYSYEHPDDPAGWLLLARAFNDLAQPRFSRMALREAGMAGADEDELLLERGWVLVLEQRFDDALPVLEGLEGARAAMARAVALGELGDLAAAEGELELATADPLYATQAQALQALLPEQGPLPEALDLRLSAGGGFVYNPGLAPRGNFMRKPDGIVGVAVDGRYGFLQDADKDLGVTFAAEYGRHFAQSWFQPRGLSLGVDGQGEVQGRRWQASPSLEHYRYDERPLYYGLTLPVQLVQGEPGDARFLAATVRALIQPPADWQHDDEVMSGVYASAGAGIELPIGPLTARLGGSGDLAFTKGASRRYLGGGLAASVMMPLGEQLQLEADYLGALRFYLDGDDVNGVGGQRLLAYGNDLEARLAYELMPGHSVVATWDMKGRLSTIAEFYGYAYTVMRVDYVVVF